MSWRVITEDDLTASLSAAEIDAYRKSSQFGDPVEAQLRSVAAYVRGVVRSSPARVRLAANPLALPESLIVPAMDYLRFGVLARCNIVVNESRTLAYNKACELFGRVHLGGLCSGETDKLLHLQRHRIYRIVSCSYTG